MSEPYIYIPAVYLAIVNLTAFFLFGLDKLLAKKHAQRIPEATLMTSAALGGFIGAFLGMRLFHHKTRHRKFTLGVPAIGILWLAALAYLLFRRYS